MIPQSKQLQHKEADLIMAETRTTRRINLQIFAVELKMSTINNNLDESWYNISRIY